MILSFHPCFDPDVQIILGSRTIHEDDLELIRQAYAIILPQGCTQSLYEACSNSHAILFPDYEVRFKYPGKIGQNRLFQFLGCSHPDTMTWPSLKKYKEACKDSVGKTQKQPFLIKDNLSHEAEGVFFVYNDDTLKEALEYLTRRESSGMFGFVTQEYVHSGGNVLRAVIIGRRIMTYWKRPSKPDQVITTISRGALIDHGWKPGLQEKASAATRILAKKTGINLAAIDFVFPVLEKDPEPYFLEINYFFGRRGLGGAERYYELLHQAIRDWLKKEGLNPDSVSLV